MLAAVAGTYAWAALPMAGAAALLFLLSRASIPSSARALDVAIMAALAIPLGQLLPLPPFIVDMLSPAAAAVRNAVMLAPAPGAVPLSIHPSATRTSALIALAAALTFWAARAILARGGLRVLCGAIAFLGVAVSMVTVAQHVTAPGTIFWHWRPPNPGSTPFGPFINRNHFATWLVLALSLTGGLLASTVRARLDRTGGGLRTAIVAAVQGNGILLCAALAVMLVALTATLSRSAFVGLIAAMMTAALASRVGVKPSWRALGSAAALTALLLVVAFWTNAQGLAAKFEGSLAGGAVSRPVIWRETLGIVRDFPLTGTGAGTFGDAMLQYQRVAPQVLFNHAHNEYLQVLTEGGVGALVLLVSIALLLFSHALRALAHDATRLRSIRIGAVAGLAGVAVQGVWEIGLHTPASLLLAAVLAAIAVRPTAHASGPQ